MVESPQFIARRMATACVIRGGSYVKLVFTCEGGSTPELGPYLTLVVPKRQLSLIINEIYASGVLEPENRPPRPPEWRASEPF